MAGRKKNEQNVTKAVEVPVAASETEIAPEESDAIMPEVAEEMPAGEAVSVEEANGTDSVMKEEPSAETEAAQEEKPVEKKRPGRKPGSRAGRKATTPKATEKKTATRKRTEKEVIQEVYFEYNGEQILSEDLVKRIQEEYKSEGHRVSSIKSLRVYINPEERKAYYVINENAQGKFVEF